MTEDSRRRGRDFAGVTVTLRDCVHFALLMLKYCICHPAAVHVSQHALHAYDACIRWGRLHAISGKHFCGPLVFPLSAFLPPAGKRVYLIRAQVKSRLKFLRIRNIVAGSFSGANLHNLFPAVCLCGRLNRNASVPEVSFIFYFL